MSNSTVENLLIILKHQKNIAERLNVIIPKDIIEEINEYTFLLEKKDFKKINKSDVESLITKTIKKIIVLKCDAILERIKDEKDQERLVPYRFQLDRLKKDVLYENLEISDYENIIDGELEELDKSVSAIKRSQKIINFRYYFGIIASIIGLMLTLLGLYLTLYVC